MRSRSLGATAIAVCLVLAAPAAAQTVPAGGAPVLSSEVPRGSGTLTRFADAPAPGRTLDGSFADWAGSGAGFAGITLLSRGELIYTDHLFDAFGADDGRDAQRLSVIDPLAALLPEAYRIDALMGADPPGQVGAPTPEQARFSTNYGDLEMDPRADLTELRVASEPGALWLLARTTQMTQAGDAALLVLLDTAPGGAARDAGFGSGLSTDRAEYSLLLAGSRGFVRDLATGAVTELPAGSVAQRPDGWDNALEARVPASALPGLGTSVALAAATGRPDAAGDGLADLGTGPDVANVAFRGGEPVREWFDKRQALALHAGSIDSFFHSADLAGLAAGATETWTPGPGYHERIMRSSEALSREEGREGILQHYGLYIPAAYLPGTFAPLQLWLHWRGGSAHAGAHLAPRIFKDLGEDRGSLVVSPRGRGTSSWYVGRGMVDIEEVWADAHAILSVDAARRYVAGHSMGGWGSFLLSVLHPDWFAASLPASPPVTQGAWTGLDFPGCDSMRFDEYSPCYIQANGGDARVQHTRRLLENLRHTPPAIYHGVADELVPVSGVTRQVERLVQLGYRHRYYLFPTQEHFGPPIWDQWTEGAAYMHSFRIPATPGRVTFVRDMPFERATERVNAGHMTLDFTFDGAYWLDGLTPADAVNGIASFDGRSLTVREKAPLTVPEAGGPAAPGQTGPYVMTGLRWADNPLGALPAAANGFEGTLRGATAATLDLARMAINAAAPVSGRVDTQHTLALTLRAAYAPGATATVDGLPAAVTVAGGAVTVTVPAGVHTVVVRP